ncbi:MAG: ABC transporter [Stutzerimonas stutzeri]|nr:MAG: ABC transporter [Stutzerimonas stutzeri]
MSSSESRGTGAPRSRSPFARQDAKDAGPRASLRQLLPYLTEQRGMLTAAVALSLAGAAASLAQPLLVSQVIASVQASEPLGALVWVLVALVIAAGLLSGLQHYLLQRMGEGVVLSTRRNLVTRMLRLPIAEYDQRRTGDLVSRVGADATLLRAVLTQGGVEAIGGAVTFVGAIIGMAILDPVLLGLTVLVVAVAIVTVTLLSGRIRVASARAQRKVGDLASAVERALSGIRTVRAANATARETAAIEREAEGAWREGIAVAKISALVVPIAGIAMQVSFLVVIGVGGFRVATGAIPIGNLVAFVLVLFMMVMPLGQAFGAVTSINQALGALGRIQEIIDLPAETDGDAAQPRRLPGVADAAIAFESVEFGYAPASPEEDARPVLRGVSFTVPRGTRTALVGPSGAGKSTILALVERFYDPSAGTVRFFGEDARELDREALRSRIGYVEQDAPVLAGTIRENLLIGAPDASDAACVAVLRSVNLGAVLDRDPAGLDAPVGEDGIMLSGGERQRLAIARALLAAPPVLLLDESTSSLDGRNEQLLREAIDEVSKDRTTVVIAHRLATVVDADQIVVLEHGEVVGIGTHRELLDSTPLYRELAEHQLLA